ncbi:DUF3782 domain-containing protein [Candidatus Bathyarchaeota archaeon]|nr:DUF3782 domain-containing protein [Candidatus Bathyarchaeota archaeon]
MGLEDLKTRIFTLLREDEEFRYAVAGMLGLEEILRRLDKHEAELVKLREDMNKLREDMLLGFKRHDVMFEKQAEEIAKLREDMIAGFKLLSRHIDALGARWGMLSESAFREGLKGIVEEEFGLKIEKWVRYDQKGYVFGYPGDVDIDVALHDERVILVEVKSHVGREDVYVFKKKADFYESVEGRKPARLIIVTPYADEDALDMAKRLHIEVYTKV